MRRISALCLFFTIVTFFLSGCTPKNASVSKSGFYFDTVITVTLYGTNDPAAIDGCFLLAKKYEALFSNTVEESDVSRINANAGDFVDVDPETVSLIAKGMEYERLSDGAFSMTLGKLTELWDFSGISKQLEAEDNRADASVLPDPALIERYLRHESDTGIEIDTENNRIRLTDPEAKLDLGGIAKGYIADRMKEYLLEEHVTAGIINLGGNVLTLSDKPDRTPYVIGIQKPFSKSGTAIARLTVNDRSVVTSGVYERYYRIGDTLYHHILDPKTGYPVKNNLYGVTILSKASADGDALSTACFVLGPEKGMELVESLSGMEAVFITNQYEILTSSGIGDALARMEH